MENLPLWFAAVVSLLYRCYLTLYCGIKTFFSLQAMSQDCLIGPWIISQQPSMCNLSFHLTELKIYLCSISTRLLYNYVYIHQKTATQSWVRYVYLRARICRYWSIIARWLSRTAVYFAGLCTCSDDDPTVPYVLTSCCSCSNAFDHSHQSREPTSLCFISP